MSESFQTLRSSSCLNYLILISEAGTIVQLLQQLHLRVALQLKAKYVVVADLLHDQAILQFFKVKYDHTQKT